MAFKNWWRRKGRETEGPVLRQDGRRPVRLEPKGDYSHLEDSDAEYIVGDTHTYDALYGLSKWHRMRSPIIQYRDGGPWWRRDDLAWCVEDCPQCEEDRPFWESRRREAQERTQRHLAQNEAMRRALEEAAGNHESREEP